ncbi:MAG: 1-phosphofructokinase family hexose kinase [Solirubrobacteraceae bacterium]
MPVRPTRTAQRDAPPRFSQDARLTVFAPTPLLTITVEEGVDRPDIHLHAGGQGFWVARMASALGAKVSLCAPLGGESGRVLRGLIESERLTLHGTAAQQANGIYIHDRRSGQRVEVASSLARPLHRHELDELYGVTLTTGLTSDVVLLTGSFPVDAVDPGVYRRLTHDLRANGKVVIADLTGASLSAVLAAGIDVLKLSHEEIVSESIATSRRKADLVRGMARLRKSGAGSVVLSRGRAPALFLAGSGDGAGLLEIHAPRFEELDHTGAGDSMFAALGVALAGRVDPVDALRLATAAGALNVTRHGLGSGTRTEIERLADFVSVKTSFPPGRA